MELIDQTIVDANTQSAFNIGPTIRSVTVSTEVATVPLFASDRQINPITLACTVMHDEGDIEIPSTIVYRINQPDTTINKYYPFEICVQFTVPDRLGHYTISFLPTPYTDYKYKLNSNFVPDGPTLNGFFYRWAPAPAEPVLIDITGPKSNWWAVQDDNINYGTGGGFHHADYYNPQAYWQINGYRTVDLTLINTTSYTLPYYFVRVTLLPTSDYCVLQVNTFLSRVHTLTLDGQTSVDLGVSNSFHLVLEEVGDGTAHVKIELSTTGSFLEGQYYHSVDYDITVGWSEFSDVVIPGVLGFVRGDGGGLYNSEKEMEWGDMGWDSAYDCLYAFEGMHGNPVGEDFTLDNVQNLIFTAWRQAHYNQDGDTVDTLSIVWVPSINTFFNMIVTHWQSGGNGHSYYRSPTDVSPEAVYIPPRDIPDGWTLQNKPPETDNAEEFYAKVCDEVWLARGDTHGLYNAATEDSYQDVGNSGPEGLKWAIQGLGSNSDLMPEELTVENAEFLTWETWVDATGGSPPYTQGHPAMCQLEALPGKYFLNKMIRWDSEEEFSQAGFSMMYGPLADGWVPPPPPPPYVNPAATVWEITSPGEQIVGVYDRTTNDYMVASIDYSFSTPIIRMNIINKSDYSLAYGWGAYTTQAGKELSGLYASGWNGTKVFAKMSDNTLNWWDPINQTKGEGSTVMVPENFPGNMAALNEYVFLGDYTWVPWGNYDINKFSISGAKTAESLSLGFNIQAIMVAKTGAIFAAGAGNGYAGTTVVGPGICKLNTTLAIAWTWSNPYGQQFDGEFPMAYNELSGTAGVLYAADYYNSYLYIINAGTGVEITALQTLDISPDMGLGVLRIIAMTADATGVYLLSYKYNNNGQKVIFVSADGTTIREQGELRVGNEASSHYRWIFLNGSDIILTTDGDGESMIYPRMVRIPKI